MLQSVGWTFALFLWMRLLKQKGRKDFKYLLTMNFFISLSFINGYSYYMLLYTKLPLNQIDLNNRKELIEQFVFGSNFSIVLTEEIKKISKYYIPHKIEHSFVTSLGQKVTFIIKQGRLYLSCQNYSEVFGYNSRNIKAKIDNLDIFNIRERDLIFGLFKLYDNLIDEYKKLHNIPDQVKNVETEIIEDMIKSKKIAKKELDLLMKSKLLRDIHYSQINFEELIKEKKDDYDKSENNENKNSDNNKTTRFYL